MVHFQYKVLVPQRPTQLLSRKRLLALLQHIYTRQLVTIAAPAGYGKTSLLIDFATSQSQLPIAWYTLDASDRDPWEFLRYVMAAMQQRFPDAFHQTAALLDSHSTIPYTTAASALIREVDAIGEHFILVIDDWHLVDHIADCRELIGQLLLRCPNCHLLLASRIHPSLPDMMLLTARQQMLGLDEEPLRFVANEVAAVLQANNLANLPFEQIEMLAERANGWITSILLTLQAGVATPKPFGDARAERQIYAFLAEQVFDQQPETIQAFLLDAALLDELTAEGCAEVLEQPGAGALLETLLRQRLFVTEIRPGVLRFHPLFREFLLERFRRSDMPRYRAQAIRIANMYAAQQQWAIAFDMCIAADQVVAAQQIARRGGDDLYARGRLETLERWFDLLPRDRLNAPLLCLHSRVLMDRNRHQEAQVLVDLALARALPEEITSVQVLQGQLAWVTGRYAEAIAIVERVLAEPLLPDAERAAALRVEGICRYRLGQAAQAANSLQEALALERKIGNISMMAHLHHDLAVCYGEQGRLREAEELYSQAYACWSTLGNLGLQALTLNSKGCVQHLAGSYAAAHATLQTAIACAQEAASPTYQALTLTSIGDLYSDVQLFDRAAAAYDQAQAFGGSAYVRSYLILARIKLHIRQGAYETAARACAKLDPAIANRTTAQLLQAAAAIGTDQPALARSIIDGLITANTSKNTSELAEAYLLRAQLASIPPVDTQALISSLDSAVAIADRLGRDDFLVIDTMHAQGLLRRAHAANWARAADWSRRQQEVRAAVATIRCDANRHQLTVHTLGTDQLQLDGQPVTLGWLKAREVLYYLLAHPHGASPEELREAIWPNLPIENSRNTLKMAIFQLRAAIPRDVIELHNRQLYRINRAVIDIEYDVEQLLQRIDSREATIDSIFAATELYCGMYLPSSDNAWSTELRAELEQRYLAALRRAAEQCNQAHAFLDALMAYRAILAVDSLDEAAHAGVMRCQIALGNRAAAIKQYRALQRLLNEELGLELEASSEIEQLYQRIVNAS